MPRDTSPDAYRIQIEALSRLSGPERLRLALEFSDLVQEIHRAGKAARAARAETEGSDSGRGATGGGPGSGTAPP